MKSARSRAAFALVGVLSAGTLAACGSSSQASDDPTGPVTIEVSIDAGLEQAAIDAFDERIAQFEKANPDIQVETKEFTWSGTTFAAELAGGTLPDVFPIPFTDGRALIEAGQIADISDLVAELPYADDFNPTIAAAGQAADGAMWAVPIAAYNQGLHYNRRLFEEAGLDPDNPPTTWDEVREAAKAIADETGQAGYAHMTQGNTGGWILTTETYALGGRMLEGEGDEVTATVDNEATTEALELLREMRWEDNSMGSSFLYDWGTINQDFAAGKIGMYVSGGANYPNLFTQNQMNPDEYGVTVLPLEGDDAGTLGGGTLAAVSSAASDAEQAAAVKWIDFYYISKLTDQEAAVAEAEVAAETDQPVGAPALPIFDRETYEEQQGWIKDLVNVPLENFAPMTDQMFDQPVIPEPAVATQDLYAALDPVVQAVLTDEDADIDALLADAQVQVQSLIDRA
ncbi:ABC transporter substrate-binding protein [Promicromonospora thailandica]|uniref:ABC-type glycerol-3-phosphate transport system, substrate-binding protein n=1 Tax=Promicromonospora thailandica TaxID=765201 RepID=A0A9X2JUW1_9MICO|nr:extracellular solute-binding protein [Promicromonospora thailandica]MCP2263912.1 ABC-type glycerol-3-phosphate transport system, substrate-binding protein [Promicromonospora thailandica]BFF17775.1 extracellular solute-binding protein [Promicromonospora thailandica]